MRTFHLMILTCLALGLMACASDEDPCGSTSGCHVPDSCGDGVCQSGETAQNCPGDCVPATCGDGTCSAADHETADNCSEDCSVSCVSDPQMPVYCADTNSCWAAGTDCSAPAYTCGGVTARCLIGQVNDVEDSQISCCGGVYHDCSSQRPQWCPAQGACVAEGACPSAMTDCELPRLDCTM